MIPRMNGFGPDEDGREQHVQGLGCQQAIGRPSEVNRLASLKKIEEALVSGPRWTGDGFYEAVIREPGGALIEFTT